MDRKNIILKLIGKEDSEIVSILTKAWESYINDLREIAEDIYDSCIADYYAKYKPSVYKRHGHPEGVNLYQADVITNDDFDIFYEFDPEKLWKYGGKNGDEKRAEVLDNVMRGIRGTTKRKTKLGNTWPRSWSTSYPNKHSKKNIWQSKERTMYTIFDDFSENIFQGTIDLFWENVEKHF